MAFTHIVTFQWREEGFADGGIAEALRSLAAGFDGVRSYLCGSDVGFTAGAYDFAEGGTFATRGSLIAHPDPPQPKRNVPQMTGPNPSDAAVMNSPNCSFGSLRPTALP